MGDSRTVSYVRDHFGLAVGAAHGRAGQGCTGRMARSSDSAGLVPGGLFIAGRPKRRCRKEARPWAAQ